MEYLISNPVGNIDISAFEESCGVGIVVTPEQIEQEVEKVLKKHKNELLEKRYVKIESNFLKSKLISLQTLDIVLMLDL